jgi:Trk K+ transport system NAD-binding subunit
MAKYHGIKQVIMHITTTSYFKSMRRIGIDAVVSKNISAVNDVLKIIHSDKDEISITPFEEIHIDALEIIVSENSKYIYRKYTIEDIPESMCLGAIIREDKCITPSYKKTSIIPGDKLLIFLHQESISKAESLFK